ncbi:MAG: phosphotransferase [bacterium]|nr:phosphotransferase [bacterium]
MSEKLLGRANAIAKQFALGEAVQRVEPFGQGRINDTFLVKTESGERYVLQKVNPIFAPSVLLDIAALTSAMKEAGMITAELVPTKAGELGVIESNECWRMLTYVPGYTKEEGVTEKEAQSAMGLIGSFHQIFQTHDHEFRHVREGFHDTQKIMTGLEKTISEYRETEKSRALAELGAMILNEYNSREHAWAHLPKRVIHGDPKLNNVRFAESSHEAVALLDLDTLGRHSVVIDIADAARSWCNRADEGDAEHAKFDLDIFRAMMEGYTKKAVFLTQEEWTAIPAAIAQIALELSARFATDAYRESYFKLDRERYPDLFTQNLAKARAQFALYRDICKKLSDIADLTKK